MADLCPHLSLHHFPFAVSLAKATSLGLLFVCFFFLCTQHFLRLLTFQALCQVMLGPDVTGSVPSFENYMFWLQQL